jgi:hypothetical protein
MGIDLLRGQFFERVEEEQGIPNVIISQAAADLPFPGEDPLDRRIRPADNPDTWFTVIGVVEDVRVDDFRQPPQPMLYLPGVSASPAYVMKTARPERIALGVTRFLPSLLFGVQALDASTFMVMSGVMLGVALIASYGSARRASGVDVVEVLGVE